jgi:hypothetical protein
MLQNVPTKIPQGKVKKRHQFEETNQLEAAAAEMS